MGFMFSACALFDSKEPPVVWSVDSMAVKGTLHILTTSDSLVVVDTVIAGEPVHTLEFWADGHYVFNPPSYPFTYDSVPIDFVVPDAGTWSISGDTLTAINAAGRIIRGQLSLAGRKLTAAYTIDSTIHWTWSGAEIVAGLNVTLAASKP